MTYTKHAKTRSRQRGFSPELLDIVLNYGRCEQTPRGGITKIRLGKKETGQIICEAKKLIQMLDRINNATIIVKDDRVITVYKHH